MTTADGPHRADGWTTAVRQRLGLGRLLPLGEPADCSWIAERAAAAVLRDASAGSGAVLGVLRIDRMDERDGAAVTNRATVTDTPGPRQVPGPPGALPHGPLRIEAGFSATAARPLTATADALREALLTAAARRLGLTVDEVDLRVTDLLEEEPARTPTPTAGLHTAEPEGAAGTAAAGVPGVVSLTRVLGAPVRTGAGHVQVELATAGGHRAVDVARAVRGAVAAAVEGGTTVSVLVTAVVEGG